MTTQPSTSRRELDRGWSRAQWVGYADRLLAGARKWASPSGARITPPGAEGGYGVAVDGLEGFARTFLIAGFRIAGERGIGVDDLIKFYSDGIRAGVDPDAEDRWVRLDEHPQAKVEAASIALILDMTRPWIWDRLDETTQSRVIDYFSPVVGDVDYPRNNWLWFRVVVQTFLRSVGGPWSADDIAADLALHDSFVRADGWLSDGDDRSFDHYVGWALHLYPILWPRMQGAAELAAGRQADDVARLDRFLQDAVTLVGGDGSPLLQGRSLIYRFAAAAPFWAGVLAEVPSVSPGALRHAAGRIVGHFTDNGVPDTQDLLSLGWFGEWRQLAQSYSGPASPYWAAKGLLGIALPADHPVWSAPAEPLPVETGDELRIIRAPGWIVSATQADGIVRVINHGTDHAIEGTMLGDSPLYARLGYSTATSPLLDKEAWLTPLEQSVVLLDEEDRPTHRAALELIDLRLEGDVAVAASTSPAHWVDPAPAGRQHGNGLEGDIRVAAQLTVHSIVRGPWEVRVVDVADHTGDAPLRLRIGGWPVAGAEPSWATDGGSATAHSAGITSTIASLTIGSGSPSIATRVGASPLGPVAAVPTLTFDADGATRVAALIELAGPGAAAPSADAHLDLADREALITWPDAVQTRVGLIDPRIASQTSR